MTMKVEQSPRTDTAKTCVEFSSTAAHKASGRKKQKASIKPKKILHFLSTQSVASPFDINMAVDSGYDVIAPHTNIGIAHTRNLVQDAIFSRPPQYGRYTGIFIGGKDALLALDMLAEAHKALVPPFEVKAFADPGGSFTTAAAMVAYVEKIYQKKTGHSLSAARVTVFGATGVVGFASAIIAALQGAHVTVVSHMGYKAIEPLVAEAKARFGVTLLAALGARDADKTRLISHADIVLCAAAAGVRVLEQPHFKRAKRNIIVADVNAVPPSGIFGVGLFDNGSTQLPQGGYAIGPLAIGDIKYKTQATLFQKLTSADTETAYDFRSAFAVARQIVSKTLS